MDNTFTFPINLSLKGKNCLILGFGKVGQRKFASLKGSGVAGITVLDVFLPQPELLPSEKLPGLIKNVIFENRSWQPGDLDDKFLVFACSSSKEENDALCRACMEKNILCNNVTTPHLGTFIMPAVVRSGLLYAAIGTAGASPLLSRHIKSEVGAILDQNRALALFLGQLRKVILNRKMPSEIDKSIFEYILSSPLPESFRRREFDKCREWLIEHMPVLHEEELNKIFNELENVFPN